VVSQQGQGFPVPGGEVVFTGCESCGVNLFDVGVAGRGQHANALTNQRVTYGVLRIAWRKLRRTRARFGDTIRGNRVIDEHRRNVGRGQTFSATQSLEEVSHRFGIKARTSEVTNTYPIGFFLVLAREVDLLLNRQALCGGDTALDRLAAAVTYGAEQDGREHGGHRRDALPTLGLNRTRDVVL